MPGQLAFISDNICPCTALAHVSMSPPARAAGLLAPGMAGMPAAEVAASWTPSPIPYFFKAIWASRLEAAASSILGDEE